MAEQLRYRFKDLIPPPSGGSSRHSLKDSHARFPFPNEDLGRFPRTGGPAVGGLSVLVAVMAGVFALSGLAFAADLAPVLIIHNRQFEPKELLLPAGVKLKLTIRNQDSIPAEFESFDLSREVVVAAHGEATIYVGPLKTGSYKFFNDFNKEMQGSIIVKPSGGGGD